jgi:hypothetical protein
MRFTEAFNQIFPRAVILCLCADRKFIGRAWLRHLILEPLMAFRLRIRATDNIERYGKSLPKKVAFSHIAVGQSQRLQGACRVCGQRVSVEALR